MLIAWPSTLACMEAVTRRDLCTLRGAFTRSDQSTQKLNIARLAHKGRVLPIERPTLRKITHRSMERDIHRNTYPGRGYLNGDKYR
jgi:hypothetical protein